MNGKNIMPVGYYEGIQMRNKRMVKHPDKPCRGFIYLMLIAAVIAVCTAL